MQLVAIDILGPLLESTQKNSNILVVADYFTRWTEAYALPNQEAGTVARKVVDEFFFRFSLPEQIHSDQGKQFESQLIRGITDLLQIRKTKTTAYHPNPMGWSNDSTAHYCPLLAMAVNDHPWDWEDYLQHLCYASIHPATGYTPFFLMFGRQARIPVDLIFQLPQGQSQYHNQYVTKLQQTKWEAYGRVEKTGHHLKDKKRFMTRRLMAACTIKVWLFNAAVPKGTSRKFHKPWSGPYMVVKQISDINYRI